MAILKVQEGWDADTEFSLPGDAVQIGRSRSCGIRLEAKAISRQHAQIEEVGGDWLLTDLDSRNGTFVNGSKVDKHWLKAGDHVGIGAVQFTFYPGDTPEEPPEPAAAQPAEEEAPAAPREEPVAHTAGESGVTLTPEEVRAARKEIRHEVGKVIVGQADVLDQVLTAIVARGHCLMVGVPGLAKTLMVRAIAEALTLDFKRIQFTPDLMPSDITGTDVLEIDESSGAKNFRFIKGPIFTNMLLADEINRTPPKTQAALLEAMQEYSVTASGYTYRLAEPFFVLATQNPLEQEGTYPLPEAQLDRFMFNILVDYPKEKEEAQIVKRTTRRQGEQPQKVLDGARILALQRTVRQVNMPDDVIRYAVSLVRASRPGKGAPDFVQESVQCGAGPRACQYLILGAKARSVLDGRAAATIDDVRACAVPVMRHRVFVNFNALSHSITPTDIVKQLVESIEPPEKNKPIRRPRPRAPKEDPATTAEAGDAEQGDLNAIRKMRASAERVSAEVQKIIVGQHDVLDQILMAILSRGHCLMVGVPGLAKTLIVRTLAQVMDLNFKRVQFTPDLMPSDITGTDILEEDERTGEKTFRFIKGPIFTNVLLADEINRTPPKTQAALLEAMQEHSVTASGKTYTLRPPFFVLATQNPLEQEGTYPLPEAQLDRFMFHINVEYPTRGEENAIVLETTRPGTKRPRKVIGAQEIITMQEVVERVPVSDHVIGYATRLVRATRPAEPGVPSFIRDWVYCGAGPRACQYLILAAKARTVLQGRCNVSCNDVRYAALPVLRHRIFTNFNADSEGVTTVDIVAKLLETVPEPGEEDYAGAQAGAATDEST